MPMGVKTIINKVISRVFNAKKETKDYMITETGGGVYFR